MGKDRDFFLNEGGGEEKGIELWAEFCARRPQQQIQRDRCDNIQGKRIPLFNRYQEEREK